MPKKMKRFFAVVVILHKEKSGGVSMLYMYIQLDSMQTMIYV